jgi:cation diffusion facilitator CzcD-associated flavoprotein CzcO
VKHLITFIRSPTWISSNFAAQHAGPNGKNFEYTAEQKEAFKDPAKLLQYRKKIEHDFNKLYQGLQYGTEMHEHFQEESRQIMLNRLNHKPAYTEKLIPSWAFGCRRLSPGEGYLESLQEDNISVVFSEVMSITPDGLIDADGNSHKVDAIICATGFDTNWCKSWPVVGRKGQLLQEVWGENPESYFSCCAKGFPNLFFILGPNARKSLVANISTPHCCTQRLLIQLPQPSETAA